MTKRKLGKNELKAIEKLTTFIDNSKWNAGTIAEELRKKGQDITAPTIYNWLNKTKDQSPTLEKWDIVDTFIDEELNKTRNK